MGEPRADKVAVVAEVKEKLEAADGVLLEIRMKLKLPLASGRFCCNTSSVCE